jgi:predicted ATPase
VLTFRPEFTPPWKPRSHISQLVLNRLGKKQIETMIEKVAADKALAADVIEQIRIKTDGVPLFVEELTKSVVEARGHGTGDGGQGGKTLGTLAIPATLQEALLARLDRLSTARQVAQLGATLGREFSYELLQAVTPLSETDLQAALSKLIEAEILYQRGVGQQTRYFFKHALIQDTAYQSLLKSTRQQYHQQIAQMLDERFPATKESQPELLAHHYTEAGLIEQAISYWQQAGEQTRQRFAFVEAVSHFTKGLELLKTQPDTIERVQQEISLQIALGGSLMMTKGGGALEVGETYTRARELCQRMGETPQLFAVLSGLRAFHLVRGEYLTARTLGEQMLRIAQSVQDPTFLLEAHYALGTTFLFLDEFLLAHEQFEQGIILYDSQLQQTSASVSGQDLGVTCRGNEGYVLWLLGYPEQALKRSNEALALTHRLVHPNSRGLALVAADTVHNFRREGQIAQELAETAIALATEHGMPFLLTAGFVHRGWALAQQGQTEEGIAQIHKGLTTSQAIGTEAYRAAYLGCLTEAYRIANQPEEGLTVLNEALAIVSKTEERWWEAELYRFKGELLLQQESKEQRARSTEQKSEKPDLRSPILDPHGEAEAYFLKAIDIARKQQAKSWELRAVMSLVRLRQAQASEDGSRNTQHVTRNRLDEAHQMLSDVYNWFTEGFDTKDLQEAKALLESRPYPK